MPIHVSSYKHINPINKDQNDSFKKYKIYITNR